MAIEVDLPPAEPEPLAVQASDDRRTQRRDMTWLAVGVVVITLITFFFGLWGSEGRLAPPLDDTFIHFQYARQLTQGHPFQFNTGDAPSSGDSAFIYPFLLAPAYLVGLGGMKALLYADALNFLAHLGFILLGYRLAYAVGGRPVALFTALFLLLDGRLNLTFLTGMETGLYAAALVAFFWTLLRATTSGGRFWLVAVTGLLAALLRTEGHILVSVVCLLTLVYAWRSRTLAPKHAWLLLPIIAGLVPYAVNIAMTGYWQFNTALSKSYWYVPYSPIYEKLSLTVGTAITAFKDIYLGLEIGRSPFPVLGLAIGMFGAAAAWSTGRHRLLHAALIITFIG